MKLIQHRRFSIDKEECSVTNGSLMHKVFRTSGDNMKSNCEPSLPNLTLSLLLALSVLHCELYGDTNLLEDNESSQLVDCSTFLGDERHGLILHQAAEKAPLCFKRMMQLYYQKERSKGRYVQEWIQAVNP